jgi:hypothetical protein
VLFAAATLALLVSFRPIGGVIVLTTFAGSLLGAALLPALLAGLAKLPPPPGVALASVAAGALGALAGAGGRTLWPDASPWLQESFVGLACATLPLVPWLARARVPALEAPTASR